MLLLDLALTDPVALESTARPWRDAGYGVHYRRFYPQLTRDDLTRYRTLVLLAGREPERSSDRLTAGDLAALTDWVAGGGVVVFGYSADGEGFFDRWAMNRWLEALGTGIVIGDFALRDTSRAPDGAFEPQPPAVPRHPSPLHDAGFLPFPAGRNHVLLVERPDQALARGAPAAFVRLPDGRADARPAGRDRRPGAFDPAAIQRTLMRLGEACRRHRPPGTFRGWRGVGRMVAARGFAPASRKVRAPQGRLPGNAWAPQGDGQGHRKQTALDPRGKGETVG